MPRRKRSEIDSAPKAPVPVPVPEPSDDELDALDESDAASDAETPPLYSKGSGKDVLTRQWKTIQAFASNPAGYTVAELAEMFGVDPKTIKRDLKTIGALFGGFDKTKREGKNAIRYRTLKESPQLGVALNWDEIFALYVGQRLMEPLRGSFFWNRIESALEKIRRTLDPERVEEARRVAPYFYRFSPAAREDDGKPNPVFDNILLAIQESRVLQIEYSSVKSKTYRRYDVWPYNFVFWREALYLVGYSCKDSENRLWKLARLADAKPLEDKFERPADFDVGAYLAKSIAPFGGDDEPVRVKIRFSGYAARIVKEEPFGANRVFTDESDDSIVVEADVATNKPFVLELLKFGRHAEILEPPELKEKCLDELRKTAAVYGFKLAPSEPGETTDED